LKLGFDLDGVLYDFHRALYTELQIYENIQQTYQDFWTAGYKTYRNNKWWDNIIQLKHIYGTQPAKKEVVELVNNLSKKYDIYYISNRPATVFDATKNWLTRFRFPKVENLIQTTDKRSVVQSLGISIFVEDRLENVDKLKDICKVYVVRQPYNEAYLDGYENIINSVMDLKGLL
jgi:uncharacterized HAD superfamily protein